MSSTFLVNKDSNNRKQLWMPNSTEFTRTMDSIYYVLEKEYPKIALLVAEGRDNHLSYFDISDWGQHDFNILFNAINMVESNIYESIKARKALKISYSAVAELRLLLYFDKRYEGEELYSQDAQVWITHDIKWSQPEWIYHLVIVRFLSFIAKDDYKHSKVFESLLKAKVTHQLNIDSIDDISLQWYFSSIDTLNQWYVNRSWSLTISDYIQEDFSTAIADLNDKFLKAHKTTIDNWLSDG